VTNVDRRAELQRRRADALEAMLDDLLPPLDGEERGLDVGTGVGALAFALASRVSHVTAVDRDEEVVARVRAEAPENVEVLVADGERLPFDPYSFDVTGCLRALHHTPRPELMVAELTRVTRPGGTILVADQLAPIDPLEAFELTRFEQARDPSTTRVLSDGDLRGLFDMNGLTLRVARPVRETREIDDYLDLAGCEGAQRDHVRGLAPTGYEAVVGWYVLVR
jgi:SAM-dependent methyltransferase